MSARITNVDFIPCDWNMFAVVTSNYNKQVIGLFKRCIGRVYDQNNKRWLFPNRSYNFLKDLMSNCEYVEIGQTIDEHVLEKVQIIIHDENEKHFHVQTPFNEDIVDLFNSLNGYFVPETKLQCFETASRENFDETIEQKEYEVKYEKDKPKSKFIINSSP